MTDCRRYKSIVRSIAGIFFAALLAVSLTAICPAYTFAAEGYEDVTGVVVTFCTDTTCVPVTSADQGAAIFRGTPAKYHVKIMTVPEGWKLSGSAEWDTELYGQIFWVPFTKVGQ